MDQQQIETAIQALEERNSRVEAEKAWEVSVFRKTTIALTTYVIAVVALVSIGSTRPFLDAVIPVVGYILSTQSLPFLKKRWLRSRG